LRGRRAVFSLGVGLTTGILAGLIGLGGAEFRLPAIVGLLGYPLRQAVPINLGVSAFTLRLLIMVWPSRRPGPPPFWSASPQ